MRVFCSILFLSFICLTQTNGMNINIRPDTTSLPKAFILGQYEKAYEKLCESHTKLLIEVCNDDMDVAYNKWLSLLEEMEDYADEINYDIKGIRVWLNVYWDKSGNIDHIAYHLKTNSRNIDQTELSAFFSSFMNHYKFPIVSERNFFHSGSASFPTFARRIKTAKDTNNANSKKKQNLVKDSVGKY